MYKYCCAHTEYFKKKFYTEKSPIHTLYAEEILENIPNGKVVIIMRDPRATLLSKNNAYTTNRGQIYGFLYFLRNLLNLSEILFYFNYYNKLYKKYKNSNRILFVKYEDLILKPKQELTKIFSLADLKYYPVHENFGPLDLRLEGRGRTKITINSSFKDAKQGKSILSKTSVSRWKEKFSKSKIKFVNKCVFDSAPKISKKFYPETKSKKGFSLRSFIMRALSKLDRFFYERKNIGDYKTTRLIR